MSEIALEQEELQSLDAGGSLPNAPDTGTNLIDETTNRGDAGGALQYAYYELQNDPDILALKGE